MTRRTKSLTVTAVAAALSVVLLYLGSLFPTGQAGFAAVACLLGIAVVIACGLGWGVMHYVAAGALALLLLPDKTVALLYAVFFGYYPVIKSLAERCHGRPLEWGIKLAVFNAALTVLLFALRAAFLPERAADLPTAVIYLLLNVVFVVFDIGLSRLIVFYENRIAKYLKKR
ncbi:MAG: hypothetical protein IJ259_08385 [Oscillospiraceae bacterium]|nr:hypothetical protein [Oscillospiraceae bacterium]